MATELLKPCEQFLAEARVDLAQSLLKTLNTEGLSDEDRLPLAKLCRRSGLVSLGLQVLSAKQKKNAAEKTEYALLLHQMGCSAEAIDLLSSVDANAVPEAHVARARCHTERFEYAEALPELTAYVEAYPSTYLGLVMRMTLAATQIELGNQKSAEVQIRKTIAEAMRQKNRLIFAKAMALQAQIEIDNAEWDRARLALHEAAQALKNATPIEQLLLEKWNAVVDSQKSKNPAPLIEIRNKAQQLGDSQTTRECDLHLLRLRFDEEIFNRLHFGTPHSGLRQKLFSLKEDHERPTEISIGPKTAALLDLRVASVGSLDLEPNTAPPTTVLRILFSDFYAPLAMGQVFAQLFPKEQFQIESSPNRIHQILARTKKWLADRRLPIEIEMHEHLIYTRVTGPVCIYLSDLAATAIPHEDLLTKLRSVFTTKPFTVQQCQRVLEMPAVTCRNFLKKALAAGLVIKSNTDDSEIFSLTPNHQSQ